MLFSEKTKLNKIMPKAKFVKLAELSTAVRNEFNNNVERLRLANILRQDTTNIPKGKTVVEINVFEFQLKEKTVSDNLIKEIDSAIPNHIIFLFVCNDMAQIAISYKEKLATSNRNKVVKIYRSEWTSIEALSLDVNGLDLDAVYNNFITQISAGKIETNEETSIKTAVEKSVEIEKLQRKIEQLKNKIKREPQFNKQLELKKDLKILENNLECLYGKDEI